jgi:hypothetical protein
MPSPRTVVALVALVLPSAGLVACANRGMEAGTDGISGGAGSVGAGISGHAGSALDQGEAGGGAGPMSGLGGGAGGVGGQNVGTGGTGGAAAGGAAAGGAPAGGAAGTGASGAAGAAGTAGSGGAGGTSGPTSIVSIDFIGGSVPTGGASGAGGAAVVAAPAMAATEKAGAKPAMNWNGAPGIMGTLSSLREADGTVTAVKVTWTSPGLAGNPGEWKNAYTDAAGDARMMNGYLDPSAAASPATITVSGLPGGITTTGYDVYVYVAGNIPTAVTRTYGYTVGATTLTVSQTGPSQATSFPGFTAAPPGGAGNYVVFRNVGGTGFTLTATPGTGMQSRAPVNGIQIVSPTGS